MTTILSTANIKTIESELALIPKCSRPGKYTLTFEISYATGGTVNALKVKKYMEYEDR
jgi:hypothetical protein